MQGFCSRTYLLLLSQAKAVGIQGMVWGLKVQSGGLLVVAKGLGHGRQELMCGHRGGDRRATCLGGNILLNLTLP